MTTQAKHMPPKFEIHEIVRVVGQPPRIRQAVVDREGIFLGWSEPGPEKRRDFGVHINEYGEMFAIPEDALESMGRIGSRENIISRSRAHSR